VDLAGTARDAGLSPRARRALDDTVRALWQHSREPTIGAAIERLNAVADGSTDTHLDKALTDMSVLRLQLRKAVWVTPQLRERVENAYREISHEYVLLQSEGRTSATLQGLGIARKTVDCPAPGL
jgi:hypothetical protein